MSLLGYYPWLFRTHYPAFGFGLEFVDSVFKNVFGLEEDLTLILQTKINEFLSSFEHPLLQQGIAPFWHGWVDKYPMVRRTSLPSISGAKRRYLVLDGIGIKWAETPEKAFAGEFKGMLHITPQSTFTKSQQMGRLTVTNNKKETLTIEVHDEYQRVRLEQQLKSALRNAGRIYKEWKAMHMGVIPV